MPWVKGVCPICRVDTLLNEEHVIPDWVEEVVADWGPFMTFEKGEPIGIAESRLNIVMNLCEPCNSRLGRDFESAASLILKPIIGGTDPTRIRLEPRHQVTIARWVVKTVILRSFVARTSVPQVFWEWLRTTGKPFPALPKGTHVWIAKYPRHAQNLPVLPEDSVQARLDGRFQWNFSTLTVGELAMFVLQQHGQREGTEAHWAEDDGMLARCAPKHRNTIMWPPEKRVGRTDIDQIHSSIVC